MEFCETTISRSSNWRSDGLPYARAAAATNRFRRRDAAAAANPAPTRPTPLDALLRRRPIAGARKSKAVQFREKPDLRDSPRCGCSFFLLRMRGKERRFYSETWRGRFTLCCAGDRASAERNVRK